MFFILIALVIILIIYLNYLNKTYSLNGLCRRFKSLNGIDLETIAAQSIGTTPFGNNFDLVGISSEEIFNSNRILFKQFKRNYIQYTIGTPFLNIVTAEDAELVLNDMNFNTKGMLYRFVHSFLGTGLLTSNGSKWHSRRKLLTPAFHFNILEQFLEIFKKESTKFLDVLEKNCKLSQNVSLTEIIPRFTLNVITETALGVKLDDMTEGDNYRMNIGTVEDYLVDRGTKPIYFFDFVYKLSGLEAKYNVYLKKVHEFSSNIIKTRRQHFAVDKILDGYKEDEFIPKKRRYAMLDTLLAAEQEGLIDHAGICEEVDTFMFEGYDTTSMGLIFSLMNLALHPDCQEKCYEEICDLEDPHNFKVSDFSQLKYLECFIKETLRLYPSVPFIERECIADTTLGNNIWLPKGSQINIHIFDIHRNPKYYNDPEKFDPERFTKENSINRHPFAYIPFSAGSRNCIGQKFAMLEMKCLLSSVIKNYKILPVTRLTDFQFDSGLILRSNKNIFVNVTKR